MPQFKMLAWGSALWLTCLRCGHTFQSDKDYPFCPDCWLAVSLRRKRRCWGLR